jgi:hypothetical protein
MTEAPATITYASVVSRESVRIALTLAALNGLEVKTADIENAYLTAPVNERSGAPLVLSLAVMQAKGLSSYGLSMV